MSAATQPAQELPAATLSDRIKMYMVAGRQAIIEQLQYRLANMMFMVHILIEPVIYLVVWTTVSEAQGGSVGGYTTAQFAGYYIIWTLVRQFNLSMGPHSFHWRIKEGRLAAELLRPVHPLQVDIGYYLGYKIPQVIYWLPMGILLWLLFRPEVNPELWQILVFPVALMLAFFVRFLFMWVLGLVCFWTERVDAIFELYFVLELLFSGRLVPLSVMPAWAQTVANFMPFQWTFYFPIEVLLGRVDPQALGWGLLAQLAWITGGYLFIMLVWKQAIKHFTAVGS
ncbi:MAG: ABC-2 family transporter protein [Anaerolineales bacterium]|nr:ABC-2 family transporter protein [Anaerolineales bacterium]MCW5855055.1 ABC-2 family transporter protein [Anaerolineales bacterium]